jgi:hypothetical protein
VRRSPPEGTRDVVMVPEVDEDLIGLAALERLAARLVPTL